MTVETAAFIADATPIYAEVLAEVGRPVLPRQTFERCVAEAAGVPVLFIGGKPVGSVRRVELVAQPKPDPA